MTEKNSETGKLWTAVDKVKERVSDLEGAVKYKIPDLDTSIGEIKTDMKQGFEGIGEQLESARTRQETIKEKGWKTAAGIMLTAITILISILVKLAMSG